MRPASLDQRSRTTSEDRLSYQNLREHQAVSTEAFGYTGMAFKLDNGGELSFTVVDTLLRLDLPQPLESGQSVTFDFPSITFCIFLYI